MKRINLQLFADGTGSAAGTGAEVTGASTVDAAQNGRESQKVVYGKQQDDTAGGEGETPNPSDNVQTFEDLIKGDYKKDFDNKVHKIIGAKTAAIKSLQESMEKLNPVLELVASRYGLKTDDVDGLLNALEHDNSLYEQEAVERGMTVDQLRELKRIERENSILKRQLETNRRNTETDRIYNEWMQQTDEMKEIYPNFDFIEEAKNDDFAKLLKNGIDVRTAYEVIHRDEILEGAMAATAAQVRRSVANNIQSNGNRAAENGTGNNGGVIYKRDAKAFTKEDRKRIAELVARGERIEL